MAIIKFGKGGSVRKLFETSDRETFGAKPRRASRVEIVETGPQAGLFYVDFSPLGPAYQFCLTRTFADYGEAVQAEQAWLLENWICP